jgi:hypothetical protein
LFCVGELVTQRGSYKFPIPSLQFTNDDPIYGKPQTSLLGDKADIVIDAVKAKIMVACQ